MLILKKKKRIILLSNILQKKCRCLKFIKQKMTQQNYTNNLYARINVHRF